MAITNLKNVTGKVRTSLKLGPNPRGTPLYGLYRYVRPQRATSLSVITVVCYPFINKVDNYYYYKGRVFPPFWS